MEIVSRLQPIANSERKYLMFWVPPQFGKSLTVSKHFPAYLMERNASKRIILGTYNYKFAADFSRSIKRILSGNGFNGFEGKQLANEWETSRNGFVKAFGMQSGITGTSADYVIIDDPIKSYAEAFSETIRDNIWNTFIYDIETREQKNTSYIIIQTRWHIDDLSGRLIQRDGLLSEGGKWDVLCMPALAEDNDILGRQKGEALCPQLHTRERLLERKKNEPSMFQALYQQSPVIDGGNIIKIDKFMKYDERMDMQFDYKLMSIDSAWEIKKENDYSVCTTWGVKGSNFYLVDIWRDKVLYPEFKRTIKAIFDKHKPLTIIMEDCASGKAFIQELSAFLPIHPYKPEGDKVSRVHAITDIINVGRVFIPMNKDGNFPLLYDFLHELSSFPKGKNDDICFAAGTKIATLFGNKNIENIKVGELVITPFGIRKVTAIDCTGKKEVINYRNTLVTGNHPFFIYGKGFIRVDTLTKNDNIDIMSFRRIISWKYKKLLYSMEYNINLWGREGITLASQQKLKKENMLKDYMWRFGNFIAEKKYKKAILFIIKTVIILITTIVIWSVFQGANILRYIPKKEKVKSHQKNNLSIYQELEKKLNYGIEAKKGELGIEKMQKHQYVKSKRKNIVVHFAKKILKVGKLKDYKIDSAQKNVITNGNTIINIKSYEENALFAQTNSILKYQVMQKEELHAEINADQNLGNEKLSRNVYNLTVSSDHVYYANGMLVSNCDSVSQVLRYLSIYSSDPIIIF